MNILLIEDDLQICRVIEKYFTVKGASLTVVNNGQDALELAEKGLEGFSLVLLDIMLPGADGFALMDQLRPTQTPVIFITARGSVADRVQGLRAGADDYLVKPFEIVELLARVESVLRRAGKVEERYVVGDVVIDPKAMRVTKGGRPVTLTPKEYELLLLFVRNRNIALFRDTIYQRVWEAEFDGDSRTVDLHVQRLRKKLGWQKRLTAIYKVGYRLEDLK